MADRIVHDPVGALDELEASLAAPRIRRSPLSLADALVLRSQARMQLAAADGAELEDLALAARIFDANRIPQGQCKALTLTSTLLLWSGDLAGALRHSIGAVRISAAGLDARLRAASPALWIVARFPETRVAEYVREAVDRLLAGCHDADAIFETSCLLALSDFADVLARAGIPSWWRPRPNPLPAPGCRRSPDAFVARLPALPEGGLDGFVARARDSTVALLWAMFAGLGADRQESEDLFEQLGGVHPHASTMATAIHGLVHFHAGRGAEALPLLQGATHSFLAQGRPGLATLTLLPRAEIFRLAGRYELACQCQAQFLALNGDALAGIGLQELIEARTAESGGAMPAAPELRQSEPPAIRRALRFIAEHAMGPVTIDDIVRASGVSRRTLEVALRDYRKTSPRTALRDARLARARQSLLLPGAKVAEIWPAVGYRSASTFARDFRQAFGVKPAQWAREHRVLARRSER